jgi:hypothetical protein
MAILNTLFVSSAIALGLLAQGATPVNALAAHGLHARHAVTPNHNGMFKHKRNTHKQRKRCIAQQALNNTTTDTGDASYNSNNTTTTDDETDNYNTPAPAPTPTPAAASYTPPANNGAGACSGGKMGLGWGPDLPSNYIPNAITSVTCYLYNWSSWAPDPSLLGSLKFAPMFWGSDHIDDFTDNVVNSGTNYGVALGMNEVNEATQANIDAGTGASLWRQYLLPLRQSKGYYLVSPSTTSAPSGITWMQQWLGQLGSNELPDALAFHWYGYQFSDLENYVNTFSAAFPGYKLWLTEFACTDFSGGNNWCDVPSFAAQAIPFLENNPAIEAYFPFGFVGDMSGVQQQNSLMDANNGTVTSVGWQYLQ